MGGRTCRAETPGPVVTFQCSRPQGHQGSHESQGLNGLVVKRWAPKKAKRGGK